MTDESDPFNDLDLQEAIDLRWTLRDILSLMKCGHSSARNKGTSSAMKPVKGDQYRLCRYGWNAEGIVGWRVGKRDSDTTL
jgi:hypothetical protein